jgi:hypothetical protein
MDSAACAPHIRKPIANRETLNAWLVHLHLRHPLWPLHGVAPGDCDHSKAFSLSQTAKIHKRISIARQPSMQAGSHAMESGVTSWRWHLSSTEAGEDQ